jgi:uncharacterized damage-inducible protein DinB
MREIDRILDQLERAYDGDAWYGPSLRAALDGVDVRVATARPLPEAHTIAEVVRHVTAWTREITRRLRLGIAQDPADGDWPDATVADEAAWIAFVEALDGAHEDLVKTLTQVPDTELDDHIGDVRDRALGSGVSRYVTLHGLVQHYVYHAGQISLLRKATS